MNQNKRSGFPYPLTNPQKHGTLGGRAGCSSILKGCPPCPFSSLTPRPNGWRTELSAMERVRWLALWQALLHAGCVDAGLSILEQSCDEGGTDDD